MTVCEAFMVLGLLLYSLTAVINLVISGLSSGLSDDSLLILSVTDLYSETKMNWFGCSLAWIGIVIINPFWWLVYKPLFYIGVFFKWLFTVGRK